MPIVYLANSILICRGRRFFGARKIGLNSFTFNNSSGALHLDSFEANTHILYKGVKNFYRYDNFEFANTLLSAIPYILGIRTYLKKVVSYLLKVQVKSQNYNYICIKPWMYLKFGKNSEKVRDLIDHAQVSVFQVGFKELLKLNCKDT